MRDILNNSGFKARFYYGTEYYRFPTPFPEEWKDDFRQMKKMGFNIIKSESSWASMEPRQGEYVWEEMDAQLDLCEKYGMMFIPNIQWEAAPMWLYREYPEVIRVDNLGQPILPQALSNKYVGWWMPCFDNPTTREILGRFMRAFISRYKDRDCLVAWDVWVEPRSRPLGECACHASTEKYRQWLKERFGTVENFNKRMKKRIGSWEDMVPPPSYTDYAEMYLWRQWAMHSVADRVRWAAEIHREVDPLKPIMTHVGMCSLVQDSVGDSSDDWQNSRLVEFYGSSLPTSSENRFGHSEHKSHFFEAPLIADGIRSLSPYFWILEVYPSYDYFHKDLTAEDLRFFAWQCVAHGAKGLVYWQYKPEVFGLESRSYGLVNLDGSENKKSREAAKIGQIISDNGVLFAQAEPVPAQVAIFFDQRSDLISKMERMGTHPGTDYLYKYALKGAYKIFTEANVSVDWITPYQLDKLSRYKVVYLPSLIIIDDQTARAFEAFVRDGGMLIGEANTGMRGENTLANRVTPGGGLEKVFGCQEVAFNGLEGVDRTPTLICNGFSVPSTVHWNVLKPTTGKIIGRWEDGSPAVVSNQYGNGTAVLIGTYPSVSNFLGREETPGQLVMRLVCQSGVTPDVTLRREGFVLAKLLRSGRTDLLFLFNYEDAKQKAIVSLPCLDRPRDLAGVAEIVEDHDGMYVSLPPRQVAIIVSQAKETNNESREL